MAGVRADLLKIFHIENVQFLPRPTITAKDAPCLLPARHAYKHKIRIDQIEANKIACDSTGRSEVYSSLLALKFLISEKK